MSADIREAKKKYRFGAFKVGMLPSVKTSPQASNRIFTATRSQGPDGEKIGRPVKKEEGPPTAALRYGFFIEFLSPRATANLKRIGLCIRRTDDEALYPVCLPNDYRSIGCGSCISLGGTTKAICDSASGVSGTGAICNPASGTAGTLPADHGRLSTGGICARRRKDRRWAGGRLRPSHCARDSTAAQSFQSLAAG
jgi:hypothetical protein